MGILKKLGKVLPKTGKSAAKRAAKQANAYAEEARAKTKALEEKTATEKKRAQKLALRGIRSKRAASHFSNPDNKFTSYGSTTIG